MAEAVTESKILPQSEGTRFGGDRGGGHLGSFGEDLEDTVGLFFGGDHVAQFVKAEHGDAGIVVDQAVEVFGFGQLGIQVKEGEERRFGSL